MTAPATSLTARIPAAVLRRIQTVGQRSVERHWALIPPDLAKQVRPQILRVGDGLLTLMAKSDALRMNRVIGLGHRGEASLAAVDEIIARYRAAHVQRFTIMLGPGPQSEVIARWLIARGFDRRPGLVLLVRACRDPVPAVETDLRVRRARGRETESAVDILAESFATPPSRKRWALATAASRDYEYFLACADQEPVATAALRIDEGLGWLGAAATLTRWRRHGAQSALIAARLKRAAKAGCTWAWSETTEHQPGRPDGSRRNLSRLGFEQACVVPQFLWVG